MQTGAIDAPLDDELARFDLGMPVIGDHKDITVGGFMAVGGVVPASYRFGLMIDTVLSCRSSTGTARCTSAPPTGPRPLPREPRRPGAPRLMTEATLKLFSVDKYGTIVRNEQSHFLTLDALHRGSCPSSSIPPTRSTSVASGSTTPRAARSAWASSRRTTRPKQSPGAQAAQHVSYDYLHGLGLRRRAAAQGARQGAQARRHARGAVQPGLRAIKNVESFTDKLLDSTVGDPTRMLIALAPLDRYDDDLPASAEVFEGARAKHDCFTFISVYLKRSTRRT